MSFEVTILGSFGGPLEGNTQCLMVHPTNWNKIDSVCLDGGAGLNSLINIVFETQKERGGDKNYKYEVPSFYENNFEPVENFLNPKTKVIHGLSDFVLSYLSKLKHTQVQKNALAIYQGIRSYYLTHSHLDHIAGLVTNSPSVYEKNFPSEKNIMGLAPILSNLSDHVFNDAVWPDLTDNTGGRLKLTSLEPFEPYKMEYFDNTIEVVAMPVSHGQSVRFPVTPVMSTFYLFRNLITEDCILLGGDMESTQAAPNKNDYLSKVWKYVAENVKVENLKGIFIECSSSMKIDKTKLYGHMSPQFLLQELMRLVNLYIKNDELKSVSDLKLDIIIMHVKMCDAESDPRLTVLQQIKELAKGYQMENIRFSVGLEGFTFTI